MITTGWDSGDGKGWDDGGGKGWDDGGGKGDGGGYTFDVRNLRYCTEVFQDKDMCVVFSIVFYKLSIYVYPKYTCLSIMTSKSKSAIL